MPESGKHILCIDCYPGWGGGENLLARQAEYLLSQGYQVSLVCPQQSLFLTNRRIGEVKTVGLPIGQEATNYTKKAGKFSSLRELLVTLPKLYPTMNAIKPDLVYAMGSRSAKVVLPVVKLQRRAFCWSAGNLYTATTVDRLLVQNSRLVICASDVVRRQYAAFDQRADTLQVLYHGVDIAQFTGADAAAVRRSLKLTDQAVLVGVVGRISVAKGPLQFVQAIAPLLEQNENLHAVIVGNAAEQDQNYLTQVQECIKQCAVPSRFHLTGWRDDIPLIMQALDVLVLPSAGEAFGLVTIEAMAAGKPVIAYATGAVPEIVVDQITGLHVPLGDVSALRDAIEHLATNPLERRRMGEAGQARAREMFDNDHVLPAFSMLIAGALRH